MWPHNSPDLNPVDYKIWGVLQERVYKTSIKDVDELRRRIAEEWDKLEQRIIDKAVGEWRKRLRACVAACGGQFEHTHISDLLYRNFQTQLFEILLFCLVKTGCFVEYNARYILHFVTGCPSQTGIVSKRLDELSWFLTLGLPSTYHTVLQEKVGYLSKITILLFGTVSKTQDLGKFATVSRSCRQLKSSMLELVDDIYRR